MIQTDELIRHVSTLSRQQIVKRGGFAPIATAVLADGRTEMYAVGEEKLNGQEAYLTLLSVLREKAEQGEVKATVIATDASITGDDGKPCDAIRLEVESIDGVARHEITPWKKRLFRPVRFGETWTRPADPVIFAGLHSAA